MNALDVCMFASFLFGDLLVCSSKVAGFIFCYTAFCQIAISFGIITFSLIYFYLNCFEHLKKWITFLGIAFLVGCFLPIYHLTNKGSNTNQLDNRVISIIGVVDFIVPSNFGGRKDAKIITLKNAKIIDKDKIENNVSQKKPKFFKAQIYANDRDLNGVGHGSLVKVFVRQKEKMGQVLPEGYDFALRQKLLGIDFSGFSLGKFKVIKEQQENSFIIKLSNLRYKIYKKIRASLPSDIANFASALIIGEGQGISANLKEAMRNSGLSHILCVSGLHLSLFSIFCFRFCTLFFNLLPYSPIKFDLKILSYIISFFLSGFYWALSGMNVATTRAFIMSSVTIFASIINRRSHSIRILGLATVIVLFLNPEDVLSPSFQLSFAATLSLITSKFINVNFFSNFSGIFRIFHVLLSNIVNSLYLSTSVSIATAPIVIYHFYSFSTYQVLANLFAIPITGLFLMPCVICSFLLIFLGGYEFVLKLMYVGIAAVIKIAHYFAALPYSVIYFGRLDFYYAIVSFIGILIFQVFKQRFFRNLGLIICFLLLVFGYNVTKPDLLIDINRPVIGVKHDKKLIIYGNNSSKFLKRYWSSWFGQREIMFYKVDLESITLRHTTCHGKKILIIYKSYNSNDMQDPFDIVINLSSNSMSFNSSNIFVMNDLLNLGNFAVFVKKDECILRGTKGLLRKTFLL